MHQCEKDENVLLDRHSELQFDREEGVETEKGEGEVEINEALPGKDEGFRENVVRRESLKRIERSCRD